ncbi:hypothetical protein [Ruegeria sp. MALMAid1280]|uniref:hypothetical protein n=1 Tax=Ruegeria sp. MALMAid1280 TaxID=3411634 RepID=UPI003B9F717E
MASLLAALLSIVLVFLFFGWRIRAVFRTAQRVWRADGLGDKVDALARHYPNDVVHEAMLRAGSDRPAQQTLTRRTFRTAPGAIVVTILVLVAYFYVGFVRPDLGEFDEAIPLQNPEAIVAVKLALLGLVIYTLIFHLANAITIDGSELVMTGPLFQRRHFDLTKLTRISLRHSGIYVLRFSDGKTARILKYVTGHDEMVQAFESALATNQESTCQNFPKSKRSAAG